MDLLVSNPGKLQFGDHHFRCALGRGGIISDKREGDGGTPVGRFALRQVFYRADRTDPPQTCLPLSAIGPQDGWCDDPDHGDYNRPVRLPHPARCERMWREDGLYDLLVVLGYNDDPPVAGLGSAIFLHVAKPDWQPTEGCVALNLDDLRRLLAEVTLGSFLSVAQVIP